ncbi:MAG: hypothetical protein CMG13_06335 [Candidatus Marinimicrobia bacterium]|nr:hypothetical protein [Candidatus Neomarinimicrobiota bacterium]|tara:strand:+ start:135 stop:2462 length:2328 start_codon:yes stop_codon:yes gene_type:complete
MSFNYPKTIAIIILQNFLWSLTVNVSGIILDFETQRPIDNANIFIKNQDIGTITNQDGYFLLPIEEANQTEIILNISVIGYKEKEILIDLLDISIDLGTIFINKKPIELDALEIHSHKNESAQISDILITGSDLNQNLKGNIATTLSNYPNIGMNSFGSVVSKPSLRGFSGDRFLLTKDGLEVGDLSQSSIDHVITLDMSEVSEIEIIRGPKSLVFGPNAIGGVVNTSLYGSPKFRAKKFHQKYFLGKESFNNSLYGNIMIYAPIGENQINLLASNRNTQNETSPIGELENTSSHIDNFKIGFTHYYKSGYINYSLEDFNMDYGIPGSGVGHPTPVDILLNKKTKQFNLHIDPRNITLNSNNFNSLDVKYNQIEYLHLEDKDGHFDNMDIFEIFSQGEYHVGLGKNTDYFQIELSSDLSVLGVEFERKEFKGYELYYTPDTQESGLSVYGFIEQNLPDLNFDILSSFRLNQLKVIPNTEDIDCENLDFDDNGECNEVQKREFETLSFSLGFKKKVDKFEINSWIMQSMRAPRVEELYSDGPHLGTYSYEIGNPYLQKEKIYGFENSISFIGSQFKTSLVTFYNYSPYYHEMAKMGDCPNEQDYDPYSLTDPSHPCGGADYIEWGSGPDGYLYKYNSRGVEAKIKGLELDLEYRLNFFELRYNLSYVRGYNKTLDTPLSYMNPMKEIATLDYKKDNLNYKFRFSKIHAQDKLGEFESYTPGALLTDFVIDYSYDAHNITVQLNNIFDKTYYNHLSRIKEISPEPGRNLVISYKVFF